MQQDETELDKTISVAERAIRNCPWSGDLWSLYAGVFVSEMDINVSQCGSALVNSIDLPVGTIPCVE